MSQESLISKLMDASNKIGISNKNGNANWILTTPSIADEMDDIFGSYVCVGCCVIGTVVPRSGWGDPSRHEKTCQVCRNKKICYLMDRSDLIQIKTSVRNFKIDTILFNSQSL